MNGIDDEDILKDNLYALSSPIIGATDDWNVLTISGNTFNSADFLSGLDLSGCLVVDTDESLSVESEILLYPNPTSNLLQVAVLNNQIPLQSISIRNAQGQLVWTVADISINLMFLMNMITDVIQTVQAHSWAHLEEQENRAAMDRNTVSVGVGAGGSLTTPRLGDTWH